MTAEEFVKVNEFRLGKEYSYKEAAKNRLGSANKTVLTNSPFVIHFEYGVQAEGYWCYDAMSIQFEDCIDYMKVFYPNYDCMFLFDHSCGHNKKCPYSLTVNGVSKGFCGSQVKMK